MHFKYYLIGAVLLYISFFIGYKLRPIVPKSKRFPVGFGIAVIALTIILLIDIFLSINISQTGVGIGIALGFTLGLGGPPFDNN